MNTKLYFLLTLALLQGCVETDVVDDLIPEKITITNPIMSLKVGESYDLMYRYLNNVGMPETASVRWETSDNTIISVAGSGEVTALQSGQSEISAVLVENRQVMDKIIVEAAAETVVVVSDEKSGTVATTSSYPLTGDFTVRDVDGGVQIDLADNYDADDSLPGLFVYLSNNPSTVTGALEIGAVTVFSGAHTYNVQEEGLTKDTYAYLLYFCKPFNVKVGHGEILD